MYSAAAMSAEIIDGKSIAEQVRGEVAKEVGMRGFDHRLVADTAQHDVAALLRDLNADARVSGILLQLPTPGHIDGNGLTWLIDPAKDVDGLTPVSAGLLAKGRPGLRPCTPAG